MRKLLLIICGCLLLTACGFKLRDSSALPPQLKQLYLKTNNYYGSLEIALRQNFRATGITFVANKTQAPYTLEIINTSFTHDTGDLNTSTQARVYHFTYKVTFSLKTKTNKVISAPQTITTDRDLTIGCNEVLEASDEVETIEHDMQRETILMLANRLNAKQLTKKLITSSYENHPRTAH